MRISRLKRQNDLPAEFFPRDHKLILLPQAGWLPIGVWMFFQQRFQYRAWCLQQYANISPGQV